MHEEPSSDLCVPKDFRSCYTNDAHNFNNGIDRLQWCAPCLVLEMGSESEGYIAKRAKIMLPVEFWKIQAPQDLREKIQKKSMCSTYHTEPTQDSDDRSVIAEKKKS